MNEFKSYHPIVNMTFFIAVISFSMFLMHPVCLLISSVCAFSYSIILNGKKAVKFNIIFVLPMLLLASIINPAFNHEGATILTYLPSGNPLTLESILYGLAAASMLFCVISWFSCYNNVMTSDKFIYIFGKLIPAMSLILSMTLRFIPRFRAQLRIVINAQKCIGRDVSSGSLSKRLRCALTITSVMLTWALENAVETADSMKSRGYGLPGRGAYSLFRFDKRDLRLLILILVLSVYLLFGCICGGMHFSYFPIVSAFSATPYSISLFTAYLTLCITPIIIEGWESYRWKCLKQKI